MTQIIPSIFVPDEHTFFNQIRMVDRVVDMIQLDITDGNFVDATTWAEPEQVSIINQDLKVELHLMVAHPVREMHRWKDVHQVKRVLFHAESEDDIEHCIDMAMEHGWMPSLVLNPDTDVDIITPYADHLFGVMLMGVHPGAQGQAYIPETTQRLQAAQEQFPHLYLELDGGVNLQTLEEIIPTGLDAVCPGSAIFGAGTPAENIEILRKTIHTLQAQQEVV